MSRRAGKGRAVVARPRAASPRALQEVLDQLSAAKLRLGLASEALRAVEGRLRAPHWDLRQPFMARRARTLREEATVRFARALDGLHALLAGATERVAPQGEAPRPRGPRARRLLIEIRRQLRYLQRAFDGGSLLLADALERFATS